VSGFDVSCSHFSFAFFAAKAYSVPVVELLLLRLKDIFLSREYEGYDYEYAWLATQKSGKPRGSM
jgi:hypothetical protein